MNPYLHDALTATAAGRFARDLIGEALLDQTDRLEATLYCARTVDRLLAMERALAAAWSAVTDATPSQELVWAMDGAAARAPTEALRLRAFDREGRLLLRRTYFAEGDGVRDDAQPKAAGHA
jgi:hypothetical protein